MEEIFSLLQAHYQIVLIGVGAVIFIGALQNWKWISEFTLGDKTRYSFVFEMWGEKGYRLLIGLVGIALIISGVVLLFKG